MAKPKSKSSISQKWPVIVAGIVAGIATVAVAIFFYWPRSRVELDDHGYDLTTALYRVCNQRSIEGIAKVEALIAESDSELGDQSRGVLSSIVDHAKSGRWREASMECRQSLEDQVQR